MDYGVIEATDPEFVHLLEGARLPVGDLGSAAQRFWACRNGSGEVVAAGGLEKCGGDVILRSVVVREGLRGQGLGTALVMFLAERAFREGAGGIFLLTEGEADFFAAHGFRVVERSDVPYHVAASPQFSEICPDSATAMRLLRE